MFELSADNAALWLRRHGRVTPDEPVQVLELADGVSNAVLRVETPARTFVLKQSRPQLRTREAWYSDVGRIWRERDVMLLLRPILPAGAVPEVLFSVEEDYAFAMSHAPEPFRNWRTVLLGGEADRATGERAGRLLGMMHAETARRPQALAPFADRTVFEQLRVEPFYRRIQERHADLAAAIQPLVERMRSQRLGLCHGDFSPKNLLVHAGGLTLVDYECGHWGDPAMDLGFFLSHVALKAIHRPERSREYGELTGAFWRGYEAAPGPLPVLTEPAIGHFAACLLARVDGTSPAPYLTDPGRREIARRIARKMLPNPPLNWPDVWTAIELELHHVR